jgi:rRNA-processing protein FCF1
MSRYEHRIVFLDTNLYLHYLSFEQVDWCKFLESGRVTLYVPAVIIRELDKHKDEHPVQRIRRRAASVCKRLFHLYDSGAGEVRRGVDVHFEPFDPQIEFASHRLNPARGDDCLLAAAIELKQRDGECEIVVVTNDVGLLMKASHHGITTWKPPAELKLTEEPDAGEKRLKDLERQIQQASVPALPQLALLFVGGTEHAAYTIPHPEPSLSLNSLLKSAEIRRQYPKAAPPEKVITLADRQRLRDAARNLDNAEQIAETIVTLGEMLQQVHPLDVEQYNNELEQFYTAYDEYLRQAVEYDNRWRRTLMIEVHLSNDGTCPAEDVDVMLDFPAGITVRAEGDVSSPPEPPQPPEPPRSLGGKAFGYLAKKLRGLAIPPAVAALPPAQPQLLPATALASPTMLISLGGRRVEFKVLRLKHTLRARVVSFNATFDSFEAASSFKLPYRIVAANVPRPVTGCLNVQVNKSDPQPSAIKRVRRRSGRFSFVPPPHPSE